MNEVSIYLPDERATVALGAALGRTLTEQLSPGLDNRGWTIYLEGPLGAGKTTLVRGFLRHLGHTGAVKSPTYTLLEPYDLAPCHDSVQVGFLKVFHFDLYRLLDPEEMEMLGIRDVLAEPDAVSLIEWPDRGEGYLPLPSLLMRIDPEGDARRVFLAAHDPRAIASLANLDSG